MRLQLPLCMVPVAHVTAKFVYSRFARTMDTVVYYIANFHDRLFNLVHILLERAIASVHVLTKP